MDTLYTFWVNITHYKTDSVHFLGLMNSANKIVTYTIFRVPKYRYSIMGPKTLFELLKPLHKPQNGPKQQDRFDEPDANELFSCLLPALVAASAL